ncbi:MAG: GNAT family N-acetyltransferase [Heliobacteriaceae bacterium]|nr:GNAT family N-acetyltransferase [Heliobacteriaceae bacterium]MDD4586839.1 GNAT family N-acetyltransferase [Heliobacteriaceae bacterium]
MDINDLLFEIRPKYKCPTDLFLLVCFYRGQEVGHLEFLRPGSFVDPRLHIIELWVNPEFRGQGFANALLAKIKEVARNFFGKAQIYALVSPLVSDMKLSRLIALYVNNGFTVNQTSFFEADAYYNFE